MGKIEETGQSGEEYIMKIAEVIKKVTDKNFPCQNLKNFFPENADNKSYQKTPETSW